MILTLLLINLFVVLAHESGFFTYMDDWVSSKWRFHHLPKIMVCSLCQTWWISLFACIITPGAFTLLNVVLCLVNAHLTKITTPLLRWMENLGYKVIEVLNRLVD